MKVGLAVFSIILLNTFFKSNAIETQEDPVAGNTNNNEFLLTAEAYAKLFKERRNEQHFVAKQMLKSKYEKNFKLLTLVYEKLFEVVVVNNATLTKHDYQADKMGFPSTIPTLQQAVMLTLENCCIAAESVLHFPEISYRIFRKTFSENWKPMLNWCIDFTNALPHIMDEPTVKLMDLLQQEINEELRATSYVNPYYKQQDESHSHTAEKQKQKKPTKKLKKGPQLSGGERNEL